MSIHDNVPTFDDGQGIIFVDSKINGYQDLISGFQTSDRVHILNPEGNGIEQISEVLSQYSNLDAMHFFTHGAEGSLQLGASTLSQATLGSHSAALQEWSNALSKDADLLFYGCNLAASPDGLLFVEQIADLTGADVAASNDLTGNAPQGADWDLEQTTGVIEATTLASANFPPVPLKFGQSMFK